MLIQGLGKDIISKASNSKSKSKKSAKKKVEAPNFNIERPIVATIDVGQNAGVCIYDSNSNRVTTIRIVKKASESKMSHIRRVASWVISSGAEQVFLEDGLRVGVASFNTALVLAEFRGGVSCLLNSAGVNEELITRIEPYIWKKGIGLRPTSNKEEIWEYYQDLLSDQRNNCCEGLHKDSLDAYLMMLFLVGDNLLTLDCNIL